MKTHYPLLITLFLTLFCAAPAFSQSLLEMSPYDVTVMLCVGPGPAAEELAEELTRDLTQQMTSRIGGAWNVTFEKPSQVLAAKMLNEMEQMTFTALPKEAAKGDKVFFLAVRQFPEENAYEILARELDVRMQMFSPVRKTRIPVSWKLGGSIFSAMMEVFSPMGEVEALEGERVTLRVRAANLPTPEEGILLMKPGMIGMPVVRYNNAKGEAQKIQPVIWTFLVVEEIEDLAVICKLETGIRAPLTARRRGRIDQVVLAVHAPRESTVLELTSRKEKGKKLAGYAVYTLGTTSEAGTSAGNNAEPLPELFSDEERKKAEAADKSGRKLNLVGRTDWKGEIEIRPQAESPLAIVIVKNGQTILAKLPMIPGLTPHLTEMIPDQDALLEAEGIVTGLNQEMVDMVASRQILIARTRARLADDDLESANKLLAEIRELKSKETFEHTITEQQKLLYSPDVEVQRQIDKMFKESLGLLGKYYDAGPVKELEEEVKAAGKSL